MFIENLTKTDTQEASGCVEVVQKLSGQIHTFQKKGTSRSSNIELVVTGLESLCYNYARSRRPKIAT